MEHKFSIWYSKKYHQKWAKHRKMGLVAYVLRYGLLIFGCTMILGLSIIRTMEGQIVGLSGFFKALPELILAGALGGFLYGIMMWFFSERNYKKHST